MLESFVIRFRATSVHGFVRTAIIPFVSHSSQVMRNCVQRRALSVHFDSGFLSKSIPPYLITSHPVIVYRVRIAHPLHFFPRAKEVLITLEKLDKQESIEKTFRIFPTSQ